MRLPIRYLRRLRYSCRTLLAVSTVVAVWFALQADRGRQRSAAIASILASGAQVAYEDSSYDRDNAIEAPRISVRRACSLLLGTDTIHVREVHFRGRGIQDHHIQCLTYVPEIRVLTIRETQVTDFGLRVVSQLRHLHTLHLTNNPFATARCLYALAGHASIETVSVTGAMGSRAGVLHCLLTCKHLKSLDLTGCDITDVEASGIGCLSGLTELNVSFTQLSDDAIPAIARLQHLESLELAFTAVTDAGTADIAHLRSLKFLNARQTGVTTEGATSLKKRIPALYISY